jgi:hypothetical protein
VDGPSDLDLTRLGYSLGYRIAALVEERASVRVELLLHESGGRDYSETRRLRPADMQPSHDHESG